MEYKGIVSAAQDHVVSGDFSKFEQFLDYFGLPTQNIIAAPEERRRIMNALPEFLESLPMEIKKDARYLSKFIAGSAVGLFDASLNFVWNEVVTNLRKKVVVYGLEIFFDAAVGEKLRAQYQSEEDLAGIKDQTLLDTCRKLELISDIVHKKLSHILTMRNDIGASHPNGYLINSYELLGWLQTCINDVLKDQPSSAAITVKSIMENLKRTENQLSQEVVETFRQAIKDLSTTMAGNLLISLFGLFVSEKTSKITRENILRLAPIIWDHATDEVKYDLGEKYDMFKLNLDSKKMHLTETFFETCNGNKYFSLDTRVIKISTLCDELMGAHLGWDNYYHEPPIAKSIMSFIQSDNDVPKEREEKIIKTFLICRIGREVSYQGGVSPGAKKYYDSFFKLLNKDQVITVLKLLQLPEIRNKLTSHYRRTNTIEILSLIKSPIIGDRLTEIIEYIISAKNHLDTVFIDKKYKDLTRGIIE
jgi:uncharacterized protein (DUF302 family)